MSFDQQTWELFFREHWLVLVIALIVLFIVIKVVKTVVKWLIVLVIIAGIIIYSGYNLDDLKSVGTQAIESLKQEAVSLMIGEAKDAKYAAGSDGSFTITTKNIELNGKTGDNEVDIAIRGTKIFSMPIDETVQNFINQAKKNG